MSTATVNYIARRADLLAQLILTRRKGVRILTFDDESDAGIDLIAQLPPLAGGGHDGTIKSYVCVQVKGTSGALEDEAAAVEYIRKLWKPISEKTYFMAPVVFLLFSMEGDQGYFSWVMEPRVDREEGPSLTRVESPEMTRITRKSIDGMLDEVEKWFKAMSEVLLREKSNR
jgi:hypothetical protein